MAVASNPHRLREIDLFKDLPNDLLNEIAHACKTLELAADETLFQQGDMGDAFYLLEEGQIHIVRDYPNGDSVVLATYGPYYVIGELSMVVGQARTGKVVAVSDCDLLCLERKDLMALCERRPELAMHLAQSLGQRLYEMNLQVREHAIGNVQARVANLLLLLTGGQAGFAPYPSRLTRMARSIGIDAERLAQVLEEWQQKGYLQYDGQSLRLHDIDTLHDIAG